LLSKIEGDYALKEKANEIVRNNLELTEEETRNIFDECWKAQLNKIK
jgi:hypothetical protein